MKKLREFFRKHGMQTYDYVKQHGYKGCYDHFDLDEDKDEL